MSAIPTVSKVLPLCYSRIFARLCAAFSSSVGHEYVTVFFTELADKSMR
jgi:hypothetical protein